MNTNKTLDKKFIENREHPIWYYKELESVDVDYVMWYLLKKTFVVEIDGSKHEITFGKNRKSEIGQCIRYDDIKNSKLCSYEVVRKGLREGNWFIITDTDTSDEFKADYNRRKMEHEKNETKEMYKSILKNAIDCIKDLSEERKDRFKKDLEYMSHEELKTLFEILMKNVK